MLNSNFYTIKKIIRDDYERIKEEKKSDSINADENILGVDTNSQEIEGNEYFNSIYNDEYDTDIESEYENALTNIEDNEKIKLENNNEDIQLSGFAKFSQEYLEIQQKLNEIQLQLIEASNELNKLATEIVPMEELIKQNSNEKKQPLIHEELERDFEELLNKIEKISSTSNDESKTNLSNSTSSEENKTNSKNTTKNISYQTSEILAPSIEEKNSILENNKTLTEKDINNIWQEFTTNIENESDLAEISNILKNLETWENIELFAYINSNDILRDTFEKKYGDIIFKDIPTEVFINLLAACNKKHQEKYENQKELIQKYTKHITTLPNNNLEIEDTTTYETKYGNDEKLIYIANTYKQSPIITKTSQFEDGRVSQFKIYDSENGTETTRQLIYDGKLLIGYKEVTTQYIADEEGNLTPAYTTSDIISISENIEHTNNDYGEPIIKKSVKTNVVSSTVVNMSDEMLEQILLNMNEMLIYNENKSAANEDFGKLTNIKDSLNTLLQRYKFDNLDKKNIDYNELSNLYGELVELTYNDKNIDNDLNNDLDANSDKQIKPEVNLADALPEIYRSKCNAENLIASDINDGKIDLIINALKYQVELKGEELINEINEKGYFSKFIGNILGFEGTAINQLKNWEDLIDKTVDVLKNQESNEQKDYSQFLALYKVITGADYTEESRAKIIEQGRLLNLVENEAEPNEILELANSFGIEEIKNNKWQNILNNNEEYVNYLIANKNFEENLNTTKNYMTKIINSGIVGSKAIDNIGTLDFNSVDELKTYLVNLFLQLDVDQQNKFLLNTGYSDGVKEAILNETYLEGDGIDSLTFIATDFAKYIEAKYLEANPEEQTTEKSTNSEKGKTEKISDFITTHEKYPTPSEYEEIYKEVKNILMDSSAIGTSNIADIEDEYTSNVKKSRDAIIKISSILIKVTNPGTSVASIFTKTIKTLALQLGLGALDELSSKDGLSKEELGDFVIEGLTANIGEGIGEEAGKKFAKSLCTSLGQNMSNFIEKLTASELEEVINSLLKISVKCIAEDRTANEEDMNELINDVCVYAPIKALLSFLPNIEKTNNISALKNSYDLDKSISAIKFIEANTCDEIQKNELEGILTMLENIKNYDNEYIDDNLLKELIESKGKLEEILKNSTDIESLSKYLTEGDLQTTPSEISNDLKEFFSDISDEIKDEVGENIYENIINPESTQEEQNNTINPNDNIKDNTNGVDEKTRQIYEDTFSDWANQKYTLS